jgi:hypothetical protein
MNRRPGPGFLLGPAPPVHLAETWNGTSWNVLPTPKPRVLRRRVAQGVVQRCIDLHGGGRLRRHGNELPLAEAGNGTNWMTLRITSP